MNAETNRAKLEETDDVDRELNLKQMCTHMHREIRTEDANMKKKMSKRTK